MDSYDRMLDNLPCQYEDQDAMPCEYCGVKESYEWHQVGDKLLCDKCYMKIVEKLQKFTDSLDEDEWEVLRDIIL